MKSWQKIFALIIIFVVLSACAALIPGSKTGRILQQKVLTSIPKAEDQSEFIKPEFQSTQVVPTSTALPRPTPIQQDSKSEEPRKTLLDEYMPRHERVAETDHFVFYAQDDYFPVDLERWKEQSEELYAYVSQRVGAESPVKISVAFMPAQQAVCPIRGLASSNDPPIVILFADPGAPEAYLLAVLSHELGHAIPARGFEGGLPGDIALTEGLASWASGQYWNDWMDVPTIHHLVRKYIDSGTYLPLHENVDFQKVYPWQDGAGEGCLARRDQVYSQWASFVDYLIERYGWDKVHQLFNSAYTEKQGDREIKYPTDYQGVLGKSLEVLELDWLDFVMQVTSTGIIRDAWIPTYETNAHFHIQKGLIQHILEYRLVTPV
jgi:hypothetical protein